MSETTIYCWKCRAAQQVLAWTRRTECAGCGADLHVCRQCRFFDPGLRCGCREPIAEDVSDRERANFCGYFEALADVQAVDDRGAGTAARAELDALFGLDANAQTQDSTPAGADGGAERRDAEARLNQLFGLDDPQ